MIKQCKVCLEEKDQIQFYKDKSRSDGFARECKLCCNIRKKKFNKENKEHVNKIQRENSKKHVERKRKYQKKRYFDNRENILKENRKYYLENRERLRKRQNELQKIPEKRLKNNERQKKWSKINRELRRKIYRKYLYANRDKANKWQLEWRKNHKIEARAHRMIRDHVRRGNIIRPNECEICKLECKPDGHHTDYSKPLEVMWLCKTCHAHQHGKLLDIKPGIE